MPITVPPSLPTFSAEYSQDADKLYVPISTSVGSPRVRRKFTVTNTVISITWELSQSQMVDLDNWYRNTLKSGSEPFEAVIASIGIALQTRVCRWLEPYKSTPSQAADWTVTGKLVVSP